MPRRQTAIETFMFGEDKAEPADQPTTKSDVGVFSAALSPKKDFLPGSLLASYPEALEAARKVVEKSVADASASAQVSWDGTVATVKAKDGKVLDRVEIHGASYDREHDEASGVRFDLTKLKLLQA